MPHCSGICLAHLLGAPPPPPESNANHKMIFIPEPGPATLFFISNNQAGLCCSRCFTHCRSIGCTSAIQNSPVWCRIKSITNHSINMALVNVMNINVLDNPTVFTNPFQFEITFEAKEALPDGVFQNPIVVCLRPRMPSSTKRCRFPNKHKRIHPVSQIWNGRRLMSAVPQTGSSTRCWRRCLWGRSRKGCTSLCCRYGAHATIHNYATCIHAPCAIGNAGFLAQVAYPLPCADCPP